MVEDSSTSQSKKFTWGGYAITILVALALIASAVFKFLNPPDVSDEFSRLGYTDRHALGLGILELACVVVYVIPQTAVLGAILLTGYLGGAIATHVRVGDNFASPVVIGILVWLAVYLRDARLRQLIPIRK